MHAARAAELCDSTWLVNLRRNRTTGPGSVSAQLALGFSSDRLADGHFRRKSNLNEGTYLWMARTTAAALVVATNYWTTPAARRRCRARVLAVLLLDPGRITEVAASLEPVDFAAEVNRIIYMAMLRLHSAGKPIDVTLVVSELRDRGQYNAEDGVSAATLIEPASAGALGSRTAAVPFPCFGNVPPMLCESKAY